MKYRHVILEGKPATGKTEISNLFKIFFPTKVIILPELATILTRENGLNILKHRKELADLLVEHVPRRKLEVQELLAAHPDAMVLEESHMGVHQAYCQVVQDRFFLDRYESEVRPNELVPDLYLRLDIPLGLSWRRQLARATKDVEVDSELVRNAWNLVDVWHAERGNKNIVIVDTNKSPDRYIREVLDVLGIEYDVFAD